MPIRVGGGGTIRRRQLFTADGVWAVPDTMVGNTVWITAIGGGSSGSCTTNSSLGRTQSGGFGGQYVQQVPVDLTEATASVPVTIGVGGDGILNSENTNPGSPTSFGTFLTVSGGVSTSLLRGGGYTNGGAAPSLIDTYNNGQIAYTACVPAQSVPGPFGGQGGAGFCAAGGGLILDSTGKTGGYAQLISNSGNPGHGYGAGGAPSNSTTRLSGAGADGALLVEWLEPA